MNAATPSGTNDMEEEHEWNKGFAASSTDFDAIMSDAETKKRMAAESFLAKEKNLNPTLLQSLVAELRDGTDESQFFKCDTAIAGYATGETPNQRRN